MKWTAYKHYTSAPISWAPRLPVHWQAKRLSDLVTSLQTGPFGSQLHANDYVLDGVPVINPAHLSRGRITPEATSTVDPDTARRLSRHQMNDGDIVLARRGELGRCALATKDQLGWLCGTGSALARPDHSSVTPAFLHAALSQRGVAEQLGLDSVGATMPNLNTAILGRIVLPVPPLAEQDGITTFLDRELAKLGTLITKQDRLIELLQEKRQAVISHAVTKGLDPDAPMKDSGIEWLGKVPAHWEVRKLGHFAMIGNGSTPNRDAVAYWSGGNFPWTNSGAVNEEVVERPSDFVTVTALRECHLPIVEPGSVLIALTGQGKTRGTAALLGFQTTINQHLAYVTPSKGLHGEYLWRLCQALYEPMRYVSDAEGSTKGALTCGDLFQMKITVPPLAEQINIAGRILGDLRVLDSIIERSRRFIDLMREHRSALISAAVTGQIDVRASSEVPAEMAAVSA